MSHRNGGKGGAIVNSRPAARSPARPHFLDYAASKGAIEISPSGLRAKSRAKASASTRCARVSSTPNPRRRRRSRPREGRGPSRRCGAMARPRRSPRDPVARLRRGVVHHGGDRRRLGRDLGFLPPTRFRSTPIPSASSFDDITVLRPRSLSRAQQPPIVPVPKNSPGCSVSSFDTKLTCPHTCGSFRRSCSCPDFAVDAHAHREPCASGISSRVTIHGPIALPVSKLLPLVGPIRPSIRAPGDRARRSR